MFDYDSRNGCMNVRPNFGCADNCGCGCAGVVVGQRGKTGPQGPAGRTGATGPTGPTGPSETIAIRNTVTAEPGTAAAVVDVTGRPNHV